MVCTESLRRMADVQLGADESVRSAHKHTGDAPDLGTREYTRPTTCFQPFRSLSLLKVYFISCAVSTLAVFLFLVW